MANILIFEDLIAWKKARTLTVYIYSLTKKVDFSKDFGLRDQVQRASGSIMHNLAEGFESSTDAEKSRLFTIARRSASEVQSELYLALDLGYISHDELKVGYELAVEIKRLINSLIRYLKSGKSIAEYGNYYSANE